MTKPKLSAQDNEFLRHRHAEDLKAILRHNVAARALDYATAQRETAIAEHDKLLAEAEAAMKDARTALIEQLGPAAASVLGVTPTKSRPRRASPPPGQPAPFFGSPA